MFLSFQSLNWESLFLKLIIYLETILASLYKYILKQQTYTKSILSSNLTYCELAMDYCENNSHHLIQIIKWPQLKVAYNWWYKIEVTRNKYKRRKI